MAGTFFKNGFKGRLVVEQLTAASTLEAEDDSGTVFMLNAATEFTTTLPSIADAGAGWNCKFIVMAAPSGADYVITENTTYDTNKILTNGIVEGETDTGTDALYNATHTTVSFANGVAVAGDYCSFVCDGTNWHCKGYTNADGGITLG